MAEFVVAKSADLTPGSMRAVRAGTIQLVVFRLVDGTLAALEDRCSHAEVKLSGGTFEECEITCPAHGARFDVRTGKQLCMPAVTPVKSFPIAQQGDNIVVTL